MPYDSIAWQPYTLSEAAEDIGELLQGITDKLPTIGYPNAGGTISDAPLSGIAAWDAGYQSYVLIQYFYISGRQFIQCLTAVSQTATSSSQTDQINIAVNNMINSIVFL